MRVDILWTTYPAKTWVTIDSKDWGKLAKKNEPVGNEILDAQEGWIYAVNIQGVYMMADHYALEDKGTEVIVYYWNDDPEDYRPGDFFGSRRVFRELKPDPRIGYQLNTDQSLERYGDVFPQVATKMSFEEAILQPWRSFRFPLEHLTRHGIWVPDDLLLDYDQFFSEQHFADWRNWGDVGPALGPLHNSRQFLFNAPDTSDSSCTPASDFNRKMSESGQTEENLTASVTSLTDEISFGFTTESGDPGEADWAAASGGDPYECSMNCSLLGGDTTFGLLTLSGSNGEFVRVNSGCTRQGGAVQGESAFASTGVQVATNTSWDPSSGADTDRYQVRIAAQNTNMHADQSFRITTDANSYAGGPFLGAAGQPFRQRLIGVPTARMDRPGGWN